MSKVSKIEKILVAKDAAEAKGAKFFVCCEVKAKSRNYVIFRTELCMKKDGILKSTVRYGSGSQSMKAPAGVVFKNWGIALEKELELKLEKNDFSANHKLGQMLAVLLEIE